MHVPPLPLVPLVVPVNDVEPHDVPLSNSYTLAIVDGSFTLGLGDDVVGIALLHFSISVLQAVKCKVRN